MVQAKTSKSVKNAGVAPKRATKEKSVKSKGLPISHGVGRRKTAVARVWLRRGNGGLVVNGKDYRSYFDTDIARADAATPFKCVPAASQFDVEANVQGGGLFAQAGAVRLGIARALVAYDETTRSVLREHDLLTVDARRKERKKYGQKAARRKFQFVKR